MTLVRRHWLAGLLALCAVLTLGLLIWPTGASDPAGSPVAERYAGPDMVIRRSGPVRAFALRLVGPASAPEVAPAPEALPALVGLAGRQAYLRSAASGEVERVSIGQEIDGWRLVAVSARGAILRGTDGDRRIEMFTTEAAPPAAPPAVAMPPAAATPPIPGG